MSNGDKQADDKAKLLVEAWKVAVDVQKHFNDLELRVRSLALSFLGVVLGAAAVAWGQGAHSWLPVALVVVGLIGWGAFFVMDGIWYHRLLIGSVKHGEAVENELATVTGGNAFGLAKAISANSPVSVRKFSLRSKHKLGLFYILGALALVLFGAGSRLLPRPAVVEKPDSQRVILACDSMPCTVRVVSTPAPRPAPPTAPRRR